MKRTISGMMLTGLLMGTLALVLWSFPLVRASYVWELPIPYVTLASEIAVDGELTEEAWDFANHVHNYSTHEKTIEFDVYLMHDHASMYLGAKIYENDFWAGGWLPDSLEAEINDRDDSYYGGGSGNDVKRMWVDSVGLGTYQDKYIPDDERHDTTIDGEGAFAFSGLRQDGELGDYYFELRIPLDGSPPEDAKLSEGVPFGMMISFTDYDPIDDVGYGYWLLRGSYLLEDKPAVIGATVDIKPGSWPNPLNKRSRGKFAVAICGTEDFDATTIDPATVEITSEGFEGGVSPLRWSFEDVATPYPGSPGGGHALGGDGYLDLVLHFSTQEIVTMLELCDFEPGTTLLLDIRGNLLQEHDGTAMQGTDTILLVGPPYGRGGPGRYSSMT